MTYHASPGRHKPQSKKMDADKSPQNSYAPHSRYIENKGSYCFSHTLHHALDYNRYTINIPFDPSLALTIQPFHCLVL